MMVFYWAFCANFCENVTAQIGEKINLTCKVYQSKECCMKMYKFINTAADDDSTICKEEFTNKTCIKMSSFSCPYTADKAMTTKFKFFMQTKCAQKNTAFTVNITEPLEEKNDNENLHPESGSIQDAAASKILRSEAGAKEPAGRGFRVIVITLTSGFIIIIIMIKIIIRKNIKCCRSNNSVLS